MNVLRRFRIRVARGPGHRFTLQDVADFVELAARRDMDPSTPVTLYVRGQKIQHFGMEVVGDEGW